MLVTASRVRRAASASAALLGAFFAVAQAAAAGPTVTVRVEGESSTLLPATTVTLGSPEPVSGCAGNSVAAAINLAVGGNWDHGEANHGAGDFTQTILGEAHAFTHDSDTWAEWVDYRWGGGICSDLLSEGDEVVMVADHEPEPFFSPTVLPLVITGVPATVQSGSPFSVKVSAVHTPGGAFPEAGQGAPEAAAGVTVSADGVSAMTGPDGTATLTLSAAGAVALRASEPGEASSRAFGVCVHNGNDGNCGTTPPPATPQLPAQSTGAPSPAYRGAFALVPHLDGLSDGGVYTPAQAPRVLSGTVISHASVATVSIELRRRYRTRCWAYDGVRERFVRARCGHGSFFKVASGASFSYLLPSALPLGRYVLDVRATDADGNSTEPARGSSRLVFYVR